jgi:hypothetical protein
LDEAIPVTCSSAKHEYHTHDAAMRAARLRMKRERGTILNVYRCEECHQWHMTSSQQKKPPAVLKYHKTRHETQW